jgi:hypothetical protein
MSIIVGSPLNQEFPCRKDKNIHTKVRKLMGIHHFGFLRGDEKITFKLMLEK